MSYLVAADRGEEPAGRESTGGPEREKRVSPEIEEHVRGACLSCAPRRRLKAEIHSQGVPDWRGRGVCVCVWQ